MGITSQLQISAPLDQPLSGGDTPPAAGAGTSVNSPDVPYFAQVAIQGHPYMIDPKQYQRTTIPAQRQPMDQSMEPGEQTLNTEGLWRRSQENWVLGGGQYYLDNIASLYSLYERAGENQSLRYRFWCSKNVNIWTSGQMTLLPLSEQKYLTNSFTSLMVMTVGNYVYFTQGATVWFSNNPSAASPSWTQFAFQTSGTPGSITSWTTDGSSIYAACGSNGIWKIPANGATTGSAKLGTATPDFVQYGNGRLLICTGPTIQEQNQDGTVTAVGAHKNPNWFWKAGCSAPNAIYLAGSAGGQVGEIYSITITPSSTLLNPPTIAAPLPVGELPQAMVFTGGYVCIGTNVGFRIANVGQSTYGALTFGPAVPIPNGVNSLAAWGEFLYFSWSKMSIPGPLTPTTNVQSSGVGRADLGRFTSALIPAYASDLQLDDSATSSTNWTVNSVCVFNGSPFWAAGASSSASINGPDPTKYAVSGMFQSGWTRYNTVEPKVLASIDYHHDALNGSVGAFVIKEDQTFITLPESTVVGSLGPSAPYATNYLVGEAFNTQVFLLPDATQTLTPVLRRYTVRALITPRRMDEIVVPIIMKSRVDNIAGEGGDWFEDVLAEFQFLQDLCNRGVIVTYQEGTQAYQCYIDRVQVKPEKWKDTREFFEGMIHVRLLTIPAD